jgi:PAS domain S-box-containing protein
MKEPRLPPQEAARQNRLDQFEILDTTAEKEFQDLVELAAHICQTPISLVSLVDRDRQWFKARHGIDAQETPRCLAFCAHVVGDREMLVVPDATQDERFADNPLVTGGPQVRFYAGAPLRTNDGYDLGTLCVIDSKPRDLSEEQLRMLNLLADQAVRQMELRLLNRRQKANVETLMESEEKFRQLADHIDGAFWLHDVATRQVVYMSKGGEKLYGLRLEDLYQSVDTLFRVAHPEDHPFLREIFSRPLKEELTYEYRILQKDGSVKYVRDRAYPIFGADGRIRRVCGIASDVTEEKRRNLEREEQRAQMLQASKLSALGEMSAGVAHEINNPITIILGKAHRLRTLAENGTLDKPTVLQTVEKIELTANRIAKIVHALLHFSRDGSANPLQETTAQKLLDEILPLCAERFHKNSVKLIVDAGPEVSFRCRPVEISQVILNLLNNAFDAVAALPNPWVKLEVRAEGEHLELWVSDAGEGVPPAIRAKIFDPFFTTKEIGKGTGIGLSLARGIVEKHGGRIWIDETNPHTCFRLRLPLMPAEAKKAA